MGGPNYTIWAILKSGEYELKAIYDEIKKKKTPISWHRMVWHVNNILRHSFILWMGFDGVLKTLKKLKQ